MMAGEASSVTVHQAEWGDTRGEAPPPSGPAVPIKADTTSPVFQSRGFSYGDNVGYGSGGQRPSGISYSPGTGVSSGGYRNSGISYQPSGSYGGGYNSRGTSYQPNVDYAPSGRNRTSIRYGFDK
ncbi:MAG: hypothetical protein R2748_15875 [Bryobacterales bacterium]